MFKNIILLENERIMLKAKEIIVEGILVVKTNADGEIAILDMHQKPLVTIQSDEKSKIAANNQIKMDSFTIMYEHFIIKTHDVEVITIPTN